MTTTTHESPKTLGQSILAFLQANPGPRKTFAVASALGMADDAGWDRFQAALATIPSRHLIRTRGPRASLTAA